MALSEKRFLHFMEIAGRDTSNPSEAITAMQMARSLLEKENLSFSDVFRKDATSSIPMGLSVYTPMAEWQKAIDDAKAETKQHKERIKLLRSDLEVAESKSSRLSQEIADARVRELSMMKRMDELRKRVEELENIITPTPPASNNTASNAEVRRTNLRTRVRYSEFFEEVGKRFVGHPYGWKQAFCDQFEDATGITYYVANLNAWEKSGLVPLEAFDFTPKLVPFERAKKVTWTIQEKNLVVELFNKGKPYKEIARICTKKFKRKVRYTSVCAIVNNLT